MKADDPAVERPLEPGIEMRVDRRGFLAVSGLSFAAASLCGVSLPVALPAAQSAPGPLLQDWSIDDMWTGYPRPSQAIGHGRVSTAALPAAPLGSAAPGSIEALFA